MWIFSTIGFFSLTQSRHEPGMMHFRGRERVDLENLCDRFQIDRQSIVETPKADYRFRLVLPPLQAVQVVTALAQDIDYSNFKDAVHCNPTQDRKGGPYMRVWSTMQALQPARDPMAGYPMLWEHAGPDDFGGEDFPSARVLDNPKARKPRGKRAGTVVTELEKKAQLCAGCNHQRWCHYNGRGTCNARLDGGGRCACSRFAGKRPAITITPAAPATTTAPGFGGTTIQVPRVS